MLRWLALLSILLSLTGCGLAETGAAAAAGGVSAAQQARQAKETEQRVQQQVNEAFQKAAEQRQSADAAQ